MLAAVSRRCPEPQGRFPRVTHPCAAHRPKASALDLHVLGAPPAFVLSQDQTLSFIPADHGSEDPGPAGTLACFETARPTRRPTARARRGGTSPARPTTAAGREPTSRDETRATPTRAARPSLPRYSTMSKNGAKRTFADRPPFGTEARPTAPLRSRRAGTGAPEASIQARAAQPSRSRTPQARNLREPRAIMPCRPGGRHIWCLPRPVQGANFTAFGSPREPGSAPPRQARSQPRGAAAGRRARRSPASGPSARRTAPGRPAGRRSGCR